MKTILYANPERDRDLACTRRAMEMLKERSMPYAVCTGLESLAREAPGAGLAVTFGGDGTILHCARVVAALEIPILGVNLGNKGFMAELEASELDLLPRALEGGYELENRMTLDVTVRRRGEELRDFALNDVVISGLARVIDLVVYGDGNPISRFSGDGLIVATPTGSTAYSMAAGGPLVEPDAENILVTPICPHILWARSCVLSPKRTVSVSLEGLGGKKAYLSVDGNDSVPLRDGDVCEIRKSPLTVRLVRLTGRSFYEKVIRKLGEMR